MSTGRTGDHPISAIKLALAAKQMRAQAGQALRSDPIAVVGMGCRVPGGAATPEQMWQLLSAGADCVTAVPRSRWDADIWYDPDPASRGKSVTKQGGFLDHIDEFDAEYFGILPREADRMDPQQRLVLEVAIEAIDDAGLPHWKLRGSRAAVYIAAYHNDYAQLQLSNPDEIDARTLTGTQNSIVANRLSYFFDLRGPSLSIDSACSSSLVAVHLACQSLRVGEVDLAIAGGVSVMIGPEMMVALSKVGFMAPDGRCKTFDSRADGFGRGEGCGIVILKRLSDALADDDRILAVVRGSAVNQDGHSTLLAAPNGIAQEALIREALATAQIDPSRIEYVEAHGTGTALGDPIEVEAIAATIGQPISPPSPCWLGSAKANFGHLEAAAGVIGFIKAVLALRHRAVPPQPNFHKLNSHISFADTRLAVPTELTPWPEGAWPRCAAVSSFGVGGTNANVVIEEAPRLLQRERAPEEAGVSRILPLSAHSSAALQAQVRSWVAFLSETPATIADICYTAALRRTHADYRIAVTGSSKQEMRANLEVLDSKAALARQSVSGRAPRIGFVFSGQGTQWYAMGRELMAEEAVFGDTIAACDRLLRATAGWSLLEELERDEERTRLADTEFAQPALFALQVGLAALWRSWGLNPSCVIGHSVGEIAALHVAGALDLPEAVRVVWQRGRTMAPSRGRGQMAAIGLDVDEAERLIVPYQGRLDIAAVNGPHSVVLSGEPPALKEVLATLAARGLRYRLLAGDYAFHSAQMEALASEFVRRLGAVRSAPPAVPVYSTVSGGRADTIAFDSAYFGRNVREPVRFMSAMKAMAESSDILVEIGPQPVLAASIIDCAGLDHPPPVLASLRRGQPERATMLRACGEAYAAGCDLNWARLQSDPTQIVDLPHYPWQRKRHWLPSSMKRRLIAPTGHANPLLSRYEIAWQLASPLPEGGQAEGSWLVFADHSGIANAVSEGIRAAGGRVCSVYAGASLLQRSTDEFVVDAADPESIRTVLRLATCPDPKGWRGIVHCWSLEVSGDQANEKIVDGALLGTGSVIALVQALAASPEVTIGSFLVVTRGATAVTGTEAVDLRAVCNSGTWALGGVIANELPELKPRTIDLDPQMTVQDAAMLGAEFFGGIEQRVAIRDGQRWVPRLRRLDSDLQMPRDPAGKSAVAVSPTGTYWITGGLGALGRETARWLARLGARHLVLSSRHSNSAADPEFLRELQQLGIDCRILAVDAGDRDRMTEAFAEVRRTMPPLRGVIHAAGVLHDAALINQRPKEGVNIRRGKVEGAWILHELTRDDPLDFFVLYSSAAVVLGTPGQAWYAAANAELDALARYRRRIGLPALSVAWGPWAGAGMAAELSRRAPDTWLARGFGTIDPATGFAELERLLVDGLSYGAIIQIDWEWFLGRLPRGVDRAFFADLSARAPEIVAAAKPDTNLPARLKAVSASQRREALMTALIGHARHVMGLDAGVQLEPAIPLREMGLDSLMAVELRNVLVQVGSKSLSATLLFDYPELERLASYLYRAWNLDFDAVGENVAPGKGVERLAMRDVASLSDADAELLLSRELETSGLGRSR